MGGGPSKLEEDFVWTGNREVYERWKKGKGGVGRLEKNICRRQFSSIPNERKLIFLDIGEDEVYPLVITPEVSLEELEDRVVPEIIERLRGSAGVVKIQTPHMNDWDPARFYPSLVNLQTLRVVFV